MGDAPGDGEVHVDPEATIDAEPPRGTRAPKIELPTSDYPELAAVERSHYVVTREIAKGGMGRVFEARDKRLGRRVAIKELLPKHRDAARRFEREARITARLQHPAIVHIYEAGVWPGGDPFYAMPVFDGRSLDKVVGDHETLNDRLGLLPNVIAIADALAYAHSQSVIHRDLKPSNVLVGEFGETVVIDWGLAKDLGAPGDPKESLQLCVTADDTMQGSVVGTPAYMPPEQARGEAVDQRADVYALGALLYKVLVGAAPYLGESSQAVLDQVKAGPPMPVPEREPGAPPDLVAIVAKAMAREPRDRYASAGELAADLKRFQTGQLVAAHNYTTRQLFWRWLRRWRLAVAIVTVAALAVASVATISVRKIVVEKEKAEQRRVALLEEHGRNELLAGNAGAALAYLVGAARDGVTDGARGFLIADAMRPFQAEIKKLPRGPVAVTKDGKFVATAGDGIELWTADGAPIRTFKGQHGRIRVLAFDPTGTQLVAAGDAGIAWVWSLDGTLVTERKHDGTILDAEYRADGKRLVTASSAGTAIVWDLEDRDHIVIDKCGHTGPVVSARFSPDGASVVTASEDTTACVWSASDGRRLTPIRGHRGAVVSAIWSSDGNWIVTASADGSACVWNAARGVLVVKPLRHDVGSVVRAVAISSDNRFVVTGGTDKVARVWELPAIASEDVVASARPIATLSGHTDAIVAVALSDDDSLVATAGLDRLAKIWDPASGHQLASYEHDDHVRAVAFVAGATRLVTGSDHSVRIWDTRVATERHDVMSPVHAIAIARDGTVAAGTDDSRVWLLHAGAARQLHTQLGDARVLAVAFTADGTRLVTAGDAPRPIVWNVATGERIGTLGEHASAVRAVAISGELVATAATDGVHLWTLDGTLVRTLDDQAATILAVAFSPDGKLVVGGADDGTIVAWDVDGAHAVPRRVMAGPISALAFASNGQLAVAGQSAVRIYRVVDDAIDNQPIPLAGPFGDIRAVAFTPDGSRLITAGDDGVANVWDAARGKLLGRREHGGAITALALSGDKLWFGSTDHTVSWWDVASNTDTLEVLAAYVRSNDPWRLDDEDNVVRKTKEVGDD